MNENCKTEIEILKKNWHKITKEEKQLLLTRKEKLNQGFSSTKNNKQRLEYVEDKFAMVLAKTMNFYFDYAKSISVSEKLNIVCDSGIFFCASFTSSKSDELDNSNKIVYEQEITFIDLNEFSFEEGNAGIFDRLFKPCLFANCDLVEIKDMKIIIDITAIIL